ncbi:F0F1 ATP synthase subunit epsilon [Phaeodactylibacter luteus]|uniref:F0F1 ATP synthase subunit epsilon n=1 Tax=Phaeodactylibacter luteus TaxID=1564516 RepID=A0A5C6RJ86_9BACT|nr:F0F1 ATP synthase subunit epsilon [Phaeodactylibacter luteus]TXB62508.1 F0F1 ATP synthase subunit epsilon [Phaeodactylibacter luteus]
MNITVLTPDQEIFRGAITSVKVPGTQGEFQVLKNHAPIVSSLEEGKITLVTQAGEFRFFNEETGSVENSSEAGRAVTYHIKGGFIEALDNEVSLLVTGLV